MVNTWEHRIKKLEVKSEELTESLNKTQKHTETISSLQTTIHSLEDQLNSQEQFNLRNEIEICGLLETESEVLMHTVLISV